MAVHPHNWADWPEMAAGRHTVAAAAFVVAQTVAEAHQHIVAACLDGTAAGCLDVTVVALVAAVAP